VAGAGKTFDSLRPGRLDFRRLGVALVLSLALHLVVYTSYQLTRQLHLLPALPLWLRPAPPAAPPEQNTEAPLEFTMVTQPSTEAPKNAKYYSSQNARAANPESERNEKQPQLNGRQTDVPIPVAAPKPNFDKLQPTPPPTPRSAPEKPPPTEPGDLALANPNVTPQPPVPERPRRLDQVLPRALPGVPMRQSGGVPRVALQPSLDVKATPFGAYDEALVEAVTQRWYDLLDSQRFALDRTGKVVIRFHLNYDGTVTDMTVLQNTVGELLGQVCQDAIHDPAPFAPWPEDMRRLVGRNFREITFTFYYY
jgi:outer membrane biosynthesis protein TonB